MSLLNKIRNKSHEERTTDLNTIEALIESVHNLGDQAYIDMNMRMGINSPLSRSPMGMGIAGLGGPESIEDREYIDSRILELSNNRYNIPTTLQEANEWVYRVGCTNYSFEETKDGEIVYINKETKQVLFICDTIQELIITMVVSDRFRAITNLPRCDWKLPDNETVNKILNQNRRGKMLLACIEKYYDEDKKICFNGKDGILKLQYKEIQEKYFKVINETVYINIGNNKDDVSAVAICDKSGKIKTDVFIENGWAPINTNEYVITFDYEDGSQLYICKFKGLNNMKQAMFEVSYYECREERLNTAALKVQFNKLSKAIEYVYKERHNLK